MVCYFFYYRLNLFLDDNTFLFPADSLTGQMGTVCKQVVFSCLTGVFQMLGAFFVAWLIVGFMFLTKSTMSWYSRPYVLVGLYGFPGIAIALFIFLQVSAAQERALKSSFLVERTQFEGAKLNLTLIVLLTYMYGIRSNVLLLLWLSSAISGRWLLDKLYQRKAIGNWDLKQILKWTLKKDSFLCLCFGDVIFRSFDRWRLAPPSLFLVRRSHFTNFLPLRQRCNENTNYPQNSTWWY